MEINKISKEYHVRKLTINDIDMIYNLSKGNPLFYKHCPPPLTKETIIEDLKALPPNVPIENKYYIGYFKDNNLIAIMDLILAYPKEHTAMIGLFMVAKGEQKKGIGTNIIFECVQFLKANAYHYIRLAYAKGNQQSCSFWEKNQFIKTGEAIDNKDYTAIVMQRKL